MSQVLVNSGYPSLPFWVNDHGRDALRSITVVSGAGALASGTVLAKRTAPAGSLNKYDAYDDSLASGLNTARGILLNAVDSTNGDVLGSLFVHGVVRSGSLIGIDDNGITDLADIAFL
jgi:hypothetical protein